MTDELCMPVYIKLHVHKKIENNKSVSRYSLISNVHIFVENELTSKQFYRLKSKATWKVKVDFVCPISVLDIMEL